MTIRSWMSLIMGIIRLEQLELFALDLGKIAEFDFVYTLVASTNINPFPNKPWFLRVCSTSLLKTLWEKEKLLVTSNFSFLQQCFLPVPRTFLYFHQI